MSILKSFFDSLLKSDERGHLLENEIDAGRSTQGHYTEDGSSATGDSVTNGQRDHESPKEAQCESIRKCDVLPTKWSEWTSSALGIVGGVLITLGASAVQTLNGYIPHAELNIFRFLIPPMFVLAIIIRSDGGIRVERKDVKWLFLAGAFFCFASMMQFGSVDYISLGSAHSCNLGMELVVMLVASIAQRKWNSSSVVAAFTCVAGIILVTQPEFLFRQPTHQNSSESVNVSTPHQSCFDLCSIESRSDASSLVWTNSNSDSTVATIYVNKTEWNTTNDGVPCGQTLQAGVFNSLKGYIMALVGGVLFACANLIFSRPLSEVKSVLIIFWVSVLSVVISLIQSAATETLTFPDCWFCILMLCLHAVLAASGTIIWLFTIQFTSSPLTAVVSITATMLLMAFIMQYTILSGMFPGHRNWIEYVGASLCLSGLVLDPLYQLWRQKQQVADPV